MGILGVVEQRPKIGTVIIASAPLIYTEHINAPLINDPTAAVELIEVRRVVEVGAVELAAANASAKQVKQLGRLLKDMEKLQEKGETEAYGKKNMMFHLLIAEASGNRFMGHLLATIRGFMERWTTESLSALPGLPQRSVKAHQEIYQAIADHDPAAASEAMRRHIEDFRISLEDYHRHHPEALHKAQAK